MQGIYFYISETNHVLGYIILKLFRGCSLRYMHVKLFPMINILYFYIIIIIIIIFFLWANFSFSAVEKDH